MRRRCKHNWLIYFGVVVTLVILVVLYLFWFIPKNEPTKAPSQDLATNNIKGTDTIENNNRFDQKENDTTDQDLSSDSDDQSPTDQSNSASDTQKKDDPTYYYDLGVSQLKEKKYSDAIKSFDAAIKLNPGEPNYYDKKAEAEVESGDKKAAIQTIETGLQNNPENVLLKNKLDILKTVVE